MIKEEMGREEENDEGALLEFPGFGLGKEEKMEAQEEGGKVQGDVVLPTEEEFYVNKVSVRKIKGEKWVNNFKIIKNIGVGGFFSKVYMASVHFLGENNQIQSIPVALKRYHRLSLKKKYMSRRGKFITMDQAINEELEILSILDGHPLLAYAFNILDDIDCPYIYIVLRLGHYGDMAERKRLKEENEEKDKKPEEECKKGETQEKVERKETNGEILNSIGLGDSPMTAGLVIQEEQSSIRYKYELNPMLCELARKSTRNPTGSSLSLSKSIRMAQRLMAEALHHLHEDLLIGHLDVKLENFFLRDDSEGNFVILGDFNTSVQLDKEKETRVQGCDGTAWYLAPECWESETGDFEVKGADVWGLGVCFYVLLARGQFPFDLDELNDPNGGDMLVSLNILKKEVTWPKLEEGMAKEDEVMELKGRKLVEKMLVKNPLLRPTIKEVLESDWLKSEE